MLISKIDNEDVRISIWIGIVIGFIAAVAAAAGVVAAAVAVAAAGVVAAAVAVAVAGVVAAAVAGVVAAAAAVAGLFNFASFHFPAWLFILLVILFAEFLIIFEKKSKKPKLGYVIGRKIEALVESLIIITNLFNIKWVLESGYLQRYMPVIMKWIGYIGAALIILAVAAEIIYLWLKLNQRMLRK